MEQEEILAQANAKVAELEAALLQMQEQNTQMAEQAKQKAISDLTTKAQAWEFAGVDAAAYAEAAFAGNVPVSMFDAAMEKAQEALSQKESAIADMKDELEAMQELGEQTPPSAPEQKEDKVLAAAKQHAKAYNVKIKE